MLTQLLPDRHGALFAPLAETVRDLQERAADISDERRAMLDAAALHLVQVLEKRGEADLVFICTHNSRRSQMAQTWAQAAAWMCGLDTVRCHSGGTEETAFNHHAIQALRKTGFSADAQEGENPQITVRWADTAPALQCRSKRFEEALPAGTRFTAFMTCSEADEACPLVPGADARFATRYEDPKRSDGSGQEADVYLARSLQIGCEMLYLMEELAAQARDA